MFHPMPSKTRRVLRLKEQNFASFKKSCWDFIFFLLLLINNTLLFHFYHVYAAYYSTDIMTKMVVEDAFTQIMPFNKINQFEE